LHYNTPCYAVLTSSLLCRNLLLCTLFSGIRNQCPYRMVIKQVSYRLRQVKLCLGTLYLYVFLIGSGKKRCSELNGSNIWNSPHFYSVCKLYSHYDSIRSIEVSRNMTVHRTLPIREFAYRGVCPSHIRGRACNHDLQATHVSHPFATTRRNAFYFQTTITSTTHHSYIVRTKFGEERPKPRKKKKSPATSSW